MVYNLSAMKISRIEALIVAVLILTTGAMGQEDKECPPSHFDLVGRYTLGKQDELNRTFTYIQQKITEIGNITFNTTPTTSYSIFNAKPTFYYRDSKQQAKILGNDTIVVYGGKLEADISFQWSKTNVITRNGTGMAFGLSDMITFAKQIVIENGTSYSYELLDFEDVTWSTGEVFQLTRLDPADASDDDKAALTRMLNNILGYKTIRNMLEEEIDKIYSYYLRASLHDEHHHIDPQFDYIWSPGRNTSNVTISMTRRPLAIDIEEDGIRTMNDIQAENANDWKCPVRSVPLLPLTPRYTVIYFRVYGNTQQFISLDFYENMIRHAISKNLLDPSLERESWESKMFQFFAGDLYEIFPQLATKYFASEPITGNCKATYSGLKVWKSTHTTFNVSIHFDCELNIRREKFLDFGVGLQLEIEGNPSQNHLNFRLKGH